MDSGIARIKFSLSVKKNLEKILCTEERIVNKSK